METKANSPSMLIDLHGIKEALTTSNNAVRVSVINAIETGSMSIMKGVSEELKSIFPNIYKEFQQIKNKNYIKLKASHVATAAIYMNVHGAGLLGSYPPTERFETLALCEGEGLELVSSGKALSEYRSIERKCKINGVNSKDVAQV